MFAVFCAPMKPALRILALIILSVGLAVPAVLANVKMPAIFSDHMVLQQGMPVPVWGMADPGEAVTVTVAGQSAKATADAGGKWMAKLPSLGLSSKPVTMTVTGSNTVTINDVLIGEVWMCSGQTNMDFPLRSAHNANTELPDTTDLQMRFFHVRNKTAHTPAPDVMGRWEVSGTQSAANFSAVGYFFGKELRMKLKQPVGLIQASWGWSPAEAWVSLDALQKEPALAHYNDAWKKVDAAYAAAMAAHPAAQAAYAAAIKDWTAKYGKDYDAAMAQWKVASASAAAAKQSPPPRPTPPVPRPTPVIDPAGGQASPSTLFNGMVAPIIPYAIRGSIWYQGEGNAAGPRADEYRTLFPAMIKNWREKWGEGDFPIIFVQLSGYGRDDIGLPKARDAQAQALSLPNTAMATAIDIGVPTNNPSPDKLDVGKRLALAARHVAYGEKLAYSGPVFQSATKEGDAIRVKFSDSGTGLVIGQAPWVDATAKALPTDQLTGFELAGADGKSSPADAKIDGNAVVVSGTAVSTPVEVRYDWKAYPQGNLYNKEGLSAPPFDAKLK